MPPAMMISRICLVSLHVEMLRARLLRQRVTHVIVRHRRGERIALDPNSARDHLRGPVGGLGGQRPRPGATKRPGRPVVLVFPAAGRAGPPPGGRHRRAPVTQAGPPAGCEPADLLPCWSALDSEPDAVVQVALGLCQSLLEAVGASAGPAPWKYDHPDLEALTVRALHATEGSPPPLPRRRRSTDTGAGSAAPLPGDGARLRAVPIEATTGSNPACRSAITSVLPSTTTARSGFARIAGLRDEARARCSLNNSLSGELTYFPFSGSSSWSLRA